MIDFEKEITHIEEELRDLKTTARRGLGSIRFFQKSQTYQSSATTSFALDITVTIADGEPLPAFLTIITPLGNEPVQTYTSQRTYTLRYAFGTSTPVTYAGAVIATCSSKIESLTVEVTE
jgi:hypothetical protein